MKDSQKWEDPCKSCGNFSPHPGNSSPYSEVVSMKRSLPYFLFLIVVISSCALTESSNKQAVYHYEMGLSSLRENNITNALVELTEAEKLTPDDPKVLNSLGLAYFKKNKFELAVQRFKKAVSIKQDFPEARNNLGLCYLAMNRWDDAIQQFRIVADDIFYNDQETATINLGRAYFGKGDYDRALSIFRSVVAGNPGNPIARLDLGRVYFTTGKTELAIAEYKKAIVLNNNYAKAYYYLGLACMKNKDNESAKSAFREVIRIVPDLEIGQLSRENLESLK